MKTIQALAKAAYMAFMKEMAKDPVMAETFAAAPWETLSAKDQAPYIAATQQVIAEMSTVL